MSSKKEKIELDGTLMHLTGRKNGVRRYVGFSCMPDGPNKEIAAKDKGSFVPAGFVSKIRRFFHHSLANNDSHSHERAWRGLSKLDRKKLAMISGAQGMGDSFLNKENNVGCSVVQMQAPFLRTMVFFPCTRSDYKLKGRFRLERPNLLSHLLFIFHRSRALSIGSLCWRFNLLSFLIISSL